MDYVKLMDALSLSETNTTFFKSICVTVDGTETDIVYADHSDTILIFITQIQKPGSFLIVTKEEVSNLEQTPEAVYTVKPVLGAENPEEQAVARFFAEQIDIDRKLCLFLCLKNYTPEVVRVIADVLINIKKSYN